MAGMISIWVFLGKFLLYFWHSFFVEFFGPLFGQIKNILAPGVADPHGTWHYCKLDIKDCSSSQLEAMQGHSHKPLLWSFQFFILFKHWLDVESKEKVQFDPWSSLRKLRIRPAGLEWNQKFSLSFFVLFALGLNLACFQPAFFLVSAKTTFCWRTFRVYFRFQACSFEWNWEILLFFLDLFLLSSEWCIFMEKNVNLLHPAGLNLSSMA